MRTSKSSPPSIQAAASRSAEIISYMASPRPLRIHGRWVEAASGRTFVSFNPATGDVLARVAEADVEDVDRAVSAATRALNGVWEGLTPADRAGLLWRFAAYDQPGNAGRYHPLSKPSGGCRRTWARCVARSRRRNRSGRARGFCLTEYNNNVECRRLTPFLPLPVFGG